MGQGGVVVVVVGGGGGGVMCILKEILSLKIQKKKIT